MIHCNLRKQAMPGGTSTRTHCEHLSAHCLALLLTLSFAFPAIAQEECGSPAPVTDENLRGEIEGRAQLLSRHLGDASLSGRIEQSRNDIFSKYPDAEQSRWNATFQYQVCTILMRSRSLSDEQKLNKLIEVQREFNKPITSRSDPPAMQGSGSLPPLTSANVLDTFEKYYRGNLSIHLHRCVNARESIDCRFILEKRDGKVVEYNFDILDRQPIKLVDNFNVYHRMVRGHFINGRGQEQKSVILGPGDRTWFSVEFDKPAEDITKVRILFPNWGDLEGPVG